MSGVETAKLPPVTETLALLSLASRGDRKAQATLRDMTLDAVADGAINFYDGFAQAEVWARMAAESGDRLDRIRLAGCLFGVSQIASNRGRFDEAGAYAEQAVETLEAIVADGGGDPEVEGWLALLPQLFSEDQQIADAANAMLMGNCKGVC